MPTFSFYPAREDGIALTFETKDFVDGDTAIEFAQALLLRHPTAFEVLIFLEWQEPEIARIQRPKSLLEQDVDANELTVSGGSVLTTSIALDMSEVCRGMAEEARGPAEKSEWLQMAEDWRSSADQRLVENTPQSVK